MAKIVTEVVFTFGTFRDDFDLPFNEFSQMMTKHYESVPPEHRSSVRVKYEFDGGAYDEGASAEFTMYYERPETPEEVAEREARRPSYQEEIESLERQTLAQLKAKYG